MERKSKGLAFALIKYPLDVSVVFGCLIICFVASIRAELIVSTDETDFNGNSTSCTKVQGKVNKSMLHDTLSNDQSVWLPMKRRAVNSTGWWYWLDGTFYGKQLSNPAWHKPGMDCAVLRAGDKIIDDDFCNKTYTMYMCESDSGCTDDMMVCFNHKEMYYNIYQDRVNWYQALQNCKEKDAGKLASLAGVKDAVLKKVADALKTSAELNVWLGLRKTEYQWIDGEQVDEFSWAPEFPCTCLENSCVIAKRQGDKVIWEQQNCLARSFHLCNSSTRDGKRTNDGKGVPWWAVAIGIVIPLSVAVGVIAFIVLRNKNRQQKEQETKSQVEKQLLTSKNDNKDDASPTSQQGDPQSKQEHEMTASIQHENHESKPLNRPTPDGKTSDTININGITENTETAERPKVNMKNEGQNHIGQNKEDENQPLAAQNENKGGVHGSAYPDNFPTPNNQQGKCKLGMTEKMNPQEGRQTTQEDLPSNDLRHKLNKPCAENERVDTTSAHYDEEKQKITKVLSRVARELVMAYVQAHEAKRTTINKLICDLGCEALPVLKPRQSVRQDELKEKILDSLKVNLVEKNNFISTWNYLEEKIKKYRIPEMDKMMKKIQTETHNP